jgi:HK97 family phage prohead protease
MGMPQRHDEYLQAGDGSAGQDGSQSKGITDMELTQRAYSVFEVKALDSARRTFKGWATTPSVDRVGDTINPMGILFKNPLALLHQHKPDKPIGHAVFGKPTKKGIEFDAEIPDVDPEYASLRDRVNTAWGELKYGLVRAVSVGFRPIKYAYKDDGGIDFQEIEVYELSIVTIPALPEAVITQVKSMHEGRLPVDFIQQIKSCDYALRKSGPVQLITRAASVPRDLKGAIPLIRR